ncbi:hypothetical protein Rs2_21489 [Raphanus sativus]|nr:hypothetical protein Rs2_21489 [Raphanus sativus]
MVNLRLVICMSRSGFNNRLNHKKRFCSWAFGSKLCQVLTDLLPVSPYLGYNSVKDFFQTIQMRPNPQCSNAACLERQKKYMLAKPVRGVSAKAKMEAEAECLQL